MEDVVEAEEPKPEALRTRLMRRSKEIREELIPILETLEEPTVVAELATRVHANRMTVAKMITDSMANGNPYKLGIKRLGMYDVIYRKVKV